jgi:hypothetical protein
VSSLLNVDETSTAADWMATVADDVEDIDSCQFLPHKDGSPSTKYEKVLPSPFKLLILFLKQDSRAT